jgi:hypothetical protein
MIPGAPMLAAMKLRLLSVLIVALMFVNFHAMAIPRTPENIPVEQLLTMGAAAIKANPTSAEAHYTVARIHYFAFVCAERELETYLSRDKGELPRVGPFQNFTKPFRFNKTTWNEAGPRAMEEMNLKESPDYSSAEGERFLKRVEAISAELYATRWKLADVPEKQAIEHISKAIDHFQAAHNLDPKNALYRLGYASLLEQAAAWAKIHPKVEAPAEVRAATPAVLREEYRKAWSMQVKADLNRKQKSIFGDLFDIVSYEAGAAYVRLAEKESLDEAEKKTLVEVRASLKQLDKETTYIVTPMVFATRPVSGIGELLAPKSTVAFPLRGWGPVGRWQWVQPDTALLVWNPSGSGHVASGAQLFGGYTWEMFWKTGYEPLHVLDADCDGSLRDDELRGIAAWFDRDRDGVSDPGEVMSLSALGVTSLATRAETSDGPHPMNPRGVTFSDGRILPTWDWMAEPAAPETAPTPPSS